MKSLLKPVLALVVAVLAAGREAEGAGESKRAAELAAAEAWLAEAAP